MRIAHTYQVSNSENSQKFRYHRNHTNFPIGRLMKQGPILLICEIVCQTETRGEKGMDISSASCAKFFCCACLYLGTNRVLPTLSLTNICGKNWIWINSFQLISKLSEIFLTKVWYVWNIHSLLFHVSQNSDDCR